MTIAIKSFIRAWHYTHSVPSGKIWCFQFEDAAVIFSIPANKNISKWLIGEPNRVIELSRLWAPDGHRPELLTQAISHCSKQLLQAEPSILALISYADPNAGHQGGVYRAASWVYLGQSEDNRHYRSASGQIVPRRKFHSGKSFKRKVEIEALGYVEVILPGKHRFARGLTRKARQLIERKRISLIT